MLCSPQSSSRDLAETWRILAAIADESALIVSVRLSASDRFVIDVDDAGTLAIVKATSPVKRAMVAARLPTACTFLLPQTGGCSGVCW